MISLKLKTERYITFNQDYRCICMATEKGFKIFSADPFSQTYIRDLSDKNKNGLYHAQMLYRCNILAVTGDRIENKGRWSRNVLVLWDDREMKEIAKLTFSLNILGIRLIRDVIVVIMEYKLCLYRLKDVILLETLNTSKNGLGLCCLSYVDNYIIIAYPSPIKGKVNIHVFEINSNENAQAELPYVNFKINLCIHAHDSTIVCMNLSSDGKMIATASSRGTLIRLFSTCDGSLLNEFRRGTKRARIYSLHISEDNRWLCATSSRNTVHVFSIYKNRRRVRKIEIICKNKDLLSAPPLLNCDKANKNQKSNFKYLLPCNTYVNSDWSFAFFNLPFENVASVCAFVSDQNCLLVICANGFIYKLRFNEHIGGKMNLIGTYHL